MIIYIHGFNSWGNTEKPQKLREMFPDITIVSPSYDSADFDTIETLMSGIKLDNKVLFMGSSLGGFIAMYLAQKHNAPCLLLNPATNAPNTIQKYLGHNQNFVTNKEYELTQENIDKLKRYIVSDITPLSITAFVNMDDDTIDPQETLTFFKDKKTVITFPDGGHRFSDIEKIKAFIQEKYLCL